MKANPVCTACLLLRRAYEIEEFSEDPSTRIALFKSILETASLYLGPDIEVALLASMTYRRLKNILELKDPYHERKQESFKIASEKAESIREIVSSKEENYERLSLAVRASTIASAVQSIRHVRRENTITAIPSLPDITAIKLHRDDTRDFDTLLKEKTSPTIVFLTGTVSELPYDYILLDTLREAYSAYIVAIIRSEPYEALVSRDDLGYTALRDYVDEIIETGSDVPTPIPEESLAEAISRLNDADAIVAKGCLQTLTMKNIGATRPVFGLLYIDCNIAARILNLKEDTYNAILF